jgi:hypothetical protein
MTNEIIKGKIIKIINSYTVLVNVGYFQGVKKDMKFIIYSEGEEIIDPDTKESLGKIENVKARVAPLHIQENFSIMETYEKEFGGLRNLIYDPEYAKKQKPLPLPKDMDNLNISTDKYVKIGDLVRQDLS